MKHNINHQNLKTTQINTHDTADNKSSNDANKPKSKRGEDPFTLIEKGNALESSGNDWSAADFFSRASRVLYSLSLSTLSKANSTTTTVINDDQTVNSKESSSSRKKREESFKIAKLYQAQSLEYFHKGRRCLIRALEFEEKDDLQRYDFFKSNQKDGEVVENMCDLLMEMLSVEEMERRRDMFTRLFVSSCRHGDDLDEKDVSGNENNFHGGIDNHNHNGGEEPLLQPVDSSSKTSTDAPPPKEGNTNNGMNIVIDDTTLLPPPTSSPSLENMIHQSKKDDKQHTIGTNDCDDEKQQNSQQVTNHDQEETLNENPVKSIEQRLAELDSTLPPRPKSDEQRLETIHNNLASLGVTLPSSSRPTIIERTEEEEIEDILAYATDEAAVYGGGDDKNGPGGENVEEILKNAGIRIPLSWCDEEEVKFKDNVAGDVRLDNLRNIVGNAATTNSSKIVDVDNIDMGIMKDKQKMMQLIHQVQGLLLDVSVCLEEDILEDDLDIELHSNEGDDGDNKKITLEDDNDDDNDSSKDALESKFLMTERKERERLQKYGEVKLKEAKASLDVLLKSWPEVVCSDLNDVTSSITANDDNGLGR